MEQLPILPLGQLVVYPHVVLPLALTDPNAVQLIDEVVRGNKRLLLGVVKPVGGAEPVEGAVMQARADELYEVGTLGSVVRMLKLGDGSVRVMVQGLERARLVEISPGPHWLVASYTTFSSEHTEDARTEALKRTAHAKFSGVIDIAPSLGEELHEVLAGITDAGKLADFVAANIDLALPAKAELLAIDEVNKRLERLAELLGQELQVLEVGSQIQEKVKSRLDQNQREYVLREQVRVIRQELGEDEGEGELDELGRRLEQAGVSPEAKKVVERELKRLRQMSPQSAEYHVARTYLEAFASLPWSRTSEDRRDLKAAREILDRDHYDLKTVKERILEYLAVRTLNPQAKGSILCFVGPPGVGKTSLGQSIAEALERRFTPALLGGGAGEDAGDREALPAPPPAQGDGPPGRPRQHRRRGAGALDRRVHPRGRRAPAGARNPGGAAQGGPRGGGAQGRDGAGDREEPREVCRPAQGAERGRGPGARGGCVHGAGVDARGRRHHVHRGDPDAREGADHAHRTAGRRDEGVGAGGVEPAARAGRGARDPARRVHADGRPPARPSA